MQVAFLIFIERVISQPGGTWFLIGFILLFLVVLAALVFRFKDHFKVVWPYVLMIFALGTLSLAKGYATELPINAKQKEHTNRSAEIKSKDPIDKKNTPIASIQKYWTENIAEMSTYASGADLIVEIPDGKEVFKYKVTCKVKYGVQSDARFQEMIPYVLDDRHDPGVQPYIRLLVYCPEFERTGVEVGIPTLLGKKKPKNPNLWSKAMSEGINKFKEKLKDDKGREKAKREFKKIWYKRHLKIYGKDGRVDVQFEWADDVETFDLQKMQAEEDKKRRQREEGR